MGRTEVSASLAPQAFRKDQRAKNARVTIKNIIPAIIASDSRVRRGTERAELIIDPQPMSISIGPTEIEPNKFSKTRKGKSRADSKDQDQISFSTPVLSRKIVQKQEAPLQIKISISDTLTAAQALHISHPRSRKNVAILNMASPLRPGGGVLNGATSQEESLCVRSTLLPSLKEEWYRLPEVGAVWSPDVCVFRLHDPSTGEDKDLGKGERFYVDIVTAAMLRFPDVVSESRVAKAEEVTEEVKVYTSEKDRELAMNKMKAVMRVLEAKGAERVVLGAWGCGAYGNPVGEIAKAWKKVLLGGSRRFKANSNTGQQWSPLREVVFAIKDTKMARDFANVWGPEIEIEKLSLCKRSRQLVVDDNRHLEELEAKVREIMLHLSQVKTPLLRKGLEDALQVLQPQLESAKGLKEEQPQGLKHEQERLDDEGSEIESEDE